MWYVKVIYAESSQVSHDFVSSILGAVTPAPDHTLAPGMTPKPGETLAPNLNPSQAPTPTPGMSLCSVA